MMQSKPGHIQIRNGCRSIEARNNVPDFFNMIAKHATRIIVLVETAQTLVAYRPYHYRSVTRNVTQVRLH
jgi:hypothetical protein